MEKSRIIFMALFLFIAFIRYDHVQANMQENASRIAMIVSAQNEPGSQQAPQRGMNQDRESRLYLQLDGLTEEQITRLDELNKKTQEKMAELRVQGRNNNLNRPAFRAQRGTLYEQHQEELKKVLTQAQWDQLQELRSDRRTSQRNR